VFKLQWSWETLIFITSRQEDRMVCPNKLKAAVRASRSVQARSCIHIKQWKMNPGSLLTEILHFNLVTWEKRFLPFYLSIPFYNTTHTYMAIYFITCKIDSLYACMCLKISRALTAGVDKIMSNQARCQIGLLQRIKAAKPPFTLWVCNVQLQYKY
jgi:hypothetical protein